VKRRGWRTGRAREKEGKYKKGKKRIWGGKTKKEGGGIDQDCFGVEGNRPKNNRPERGIKLRGEKMIPHLIWERVGTPPIFGKPELVRTGDHRERAKSEKKIFSSDT